MSAPFIPEGLEELDTAGAAIELARAGIYVGPLKQGSKHPGSALHGNWQAQTTRDPQQIVEWFAGRNLGLFIHLGRSGLVAFDVDYPDLVPDVLAATLGPAPFQSTRSDQEGRGHYVFRQPPGRRLGNGKGKLGGKWGEVRGNNGVIVCCPTVHEKAAEGARYLWNRTGPIPVLAPTVAELLPDADVAADAVTDEVVAQFLEEHTDSSDNGLLRVVVSNFERKVAAGESRHETMLSCVCWAAREARAGLYGARLARDELEVRFLAAMKEGDRMLSAKAAGAEFAGMFSWAVAQALAVDDDDLAERRDKAAAASEKFQREQEALSTLKVPDLRSLPSLRSQGQAKPPIELPGGFELWTGADTPTERPELVDGPAFDVLPGQIVKELVPYTEAEAGGILLSLLTAAGAAIGPGPHLVTGNTEHPARLSVLLTGATSRGRKGTSWEAIKPILERVDPTFFPARVMSGFGSGEAVVDEVADTDDTDEDSDSQPTDKRLLLKDSEFTRTLKVAARDGSTLSELIREAWDGGRLQVRSRAKRSVATGAHVSVIGHVTVDGLRRHLADEDAVNGFANRLLFCAVGRSSILPYGAELPEALIEDSAAYLSEAFTSARTRGRVDWSDAARDAWVEFYYRCADDEFAGLVGAITARAEPQVARLSLLYSLLDPDATAIEVEHHQAAEAIWNHSVATVQWVFGDREGDPDADKLLAAIRATGASGMTGTEQRDLFGKHKGRNLERIRERLERRGLIVSGMVPTEGRSALVSVAVQPATEATEATEGQEAVR